MFQTTIPPSSSSLAVLAEKPQTNLEEVSKSFLNTRTAPYSGAVPHHTRAGNYFPIFPDTRSVPMEGRLICSVHGLHGSNTTSSGRSRRKTVVKSIIEHFSEINYDCCTKQTTQLVLKWESCNIGHILSLFLAGHFRKRGVTFAFSEDPNEPSCAVRRESKPQI